MSRAREVLLDRVSFNERMNSDKRLFFPAKRGPVV
jgi:hypothetical protein